MRETKWLLAVLAAASVMMMMAGCSSETKPIDEDDLVSSVTVNAAGVDNIKYSKKPYAVAKTPNGEKIFLLTNSCDSLVITFNADGCVAANNESLKSIDGRGSYRYVVLASDIDTGVIDVNISGGFFPGMPAPTEAEFKVSGAENGTIEYSHIRYDGCINEYISEGVILGDTIIHTDAHGKITLNLTPKAGYKAIVNGKEGNVHNLPTGQQGDFVHQIDFVEE